MEDVNRWIDFNSINSFLTGKKYADILVKFFRYIYDLGLKYTNRLEKYVLEDYIKYLLYGDTIHVKLDGNISLNQAKSHIGVIQNFYFWLEDQLGVSKQQSPSTFYNNKKFLYGQIYNFELKNSSLIKLRYKAPRKHLKWFDKEYVKKMLERLNSIRDKCIFLCLYKTGARISEIIGLKIYNYDNNNRILSIRKDKFNENEAMVKTNERDLIIPGELCDLIDQYIMGERADVEKKVGWSDYLFLNHQGPTIGKAIEYNNILAIFKRAGFNAGFDKKEIITHSGRSTRAQQLVEASIDQPELGITDNFIMDEMGWGSINTLRSYKKELSIERRKKVLEALNDK